MVKDEKQYYENSEVLYAHSKCSSYFVLTFTFTIFVDRFFRNVKFLENCWCSNHDIISCNFPNIVLEQNTPSLRSCSLEHIQRNDLHTFFTSHRIMNNTIKKKQLVKR